MMKKGSRKEKKSQRKRKASQSKVIGWINLGFKTERIKIFHKPKLDQRQWLNLKPEQWEMDSPFKVPLRPLCLKTSNKGSGEKWQEPE